MTTLPNDDFNRRLTQIVPYPGFVVSYSRLEDELKPPSLSPIGPTHSDIGLVADDPNGIVRVHSDGAIPSRRVMWDLCCADTGFLALPFMKGEQQQQQEAASSSQRARSSTKKFQRRSTVNAIKMAEMIVFQQEMREQQQLRQQHSSQESQNVDIAVVQQDSRKSSSQEGYETYLRRRSSSATTFAAMSDKSDELLQQQQQQQQQQAAQNPSQAVVPTRMTEEENNDQEKERYTGYREDYLLGDVVKLSSHMIIESSPNRAIRAVESLQLHDFAWVKRSDGLYTYAILAYRSTSPLTESPSTTEEE